MKYRFTKFEIHGQEVIVEADNEIVAREMIRGGEGEEVGEAFYLRDSQESPQPMDPN